MKTTLPTVPAAAAQPEDLITRRELLRRLKGTISEAKFRELLKRKLIPVIDLGHRTKRYRLSAVRKALIKLESEVIEA
jgi:hypothetical protein